MQRHQQAGDRLEPAMILCGNPQAQYLAHRAEIDAAIQRVLLGERYVLGAEVRAFEREFAAYAGVGHAVGVASGTDALHLALRACGIGPGDEVITVSHTAVATVAAIEMAGATPVLVDIDPRTFTLDPARMAAALTPRTKALVPVHLYGQACDLEPILAFAKARGLYVVEDCAQAHGALYHGRRAGSWGHIASFSFYPTKNLGAIGDGGAVVTNDSALDAKVRLLREYGWAKRYVSQTIGFNSRLDELQAAILRVKLRYLDPDNLARVQIADRYDAQLADTGLGLPLRARTEPGAHVFHLYVVRSRQRDALQTHLARQGVVAMIHYPVPVHAQPAYAGRIATPGGMAHTDAAAREVLSLPIYPELTDVEVAQVAAAIRDFP